MLADMPAVHDTDRYGTVVGRMYVPYAAFATCEGVQQRRRTEGQQLKTGGGDGYSWGARSDLEREALRTTNHMKNPERSANQLTPRFFPPVCPTISRLPQLLAASAVPVLSPRE